jgi:hypothetical protein
LQVSSVQGLLSLHVIALPAQTPSVHASVAVHAVPSSHDVPFVVFGCWHASLAPSHWSSVH